MNVGEKQYLSVGEAAKVLGVSPSTVRYYTKKGHLPKKRHGLNKFRLYEARDIKALLKKMEG